MPASPHAAALEALYRTERPRVLALCVHVTGSVQDAEDAAQETFTLAHRALATFRGEASLLTWVLRIGVRVALEARARRGRRTFVGVPEDLAADTDTHAQIAAREELRRFLDALDTLPVEQRAVLGLSAIDGLTHGEIASVLGIAEGTVWSRLARARARLAELIT
jgi:RNA polymerase sigma-70 factor (ECF subfamily)